MIEVCDLKKTFGNKKALDGISFEVRTGETFGLLGPNGAGKSTTLKILTGKLAPSYGEARVLGVDISRDKNRIVYQIGNVPENANLYERLTAGQNLEFFGRLYGCGPDSVNEMLDKVKLMKEKDTPVKKLSKGMRQRILIARGLLHHPKVLFLDEPTSGLDPASADDILYVLEELGRGGITTLLTSHNMEEVDRLCDRVAFLNEGKIAAAGTPEELKQRYGENRIRVVIDGREGREEKLIAPNGEESARLMAEWMKSGRVRSVHSCEPTLSEIFVTVTGRAAQ